MDGVFAPVGRLFEFTTSGVTLTSQTRLILLTDILPGAKGAQQPTTVGLWGSVGTPGAASFVYFNFTSNPTPPAIAPPVAGTTTVGTPASVYSFIDTVLTRPVFFCIPSFTPDPSGRGDSNIPGIFMQDVAVGTSVSYFVQFGNWVFQ